MGMHWWENSIFHASWNNLMYNIHPNLAEQLDHPVREGIFSASSATGWWSLILFILIPFVWYKLKHGIKNLKFWLVTLFLLALGLAASLGLIEVKHGYGVEIGNVHIENHP